MSAKMTPARPSGINRSVDAGPLPASITIS